MSDDPQQDLFAKVGDIDLTRWLIADLHDGLSGKLSRFRQLTDLSASLGVGGTMMPGGELVAYAWNEARVSFIHGNYIATVILCQSLAEHMLAANLALGLDSEKIADRIRFSDTISKCLARGTISDEVAGDLKKLMQIRNPLSHYRDIGDPHSLTRRMLNSGMPTNFHLYQDASFALVAAVKLLSLPAFALSGDAFDAE